MNLLCCQSDLLTGRPLLTQRERVLDPLEGGGQGSRDDW